MRKSAPKRATTTVISHFHKGLSTPSVTCTGGPSISCHVKTSGGFNRTFISETGRGLLTSDKKNIPPSQRAIKKRKVTNSVTPSVTSEPQLERENIILLPVRKTVAALTKVSSDLSRRSFQFLEEVEESHRQATKKKRISQCLLGLKAASERSIDIQNYVLERSEPSPLKCLVGDVGLALFSPLDPEAFERPHQEDDGSTLPDILDEQDVKYPIDLEIEPSWVLATCPRVLTPDMIVQLVDQALPPAVKTMQWRRVFALGRDGDSFLTMLDHCDGYSNTLVVIETSKGDVIGGFAAAPWKGGGRRSFSGSEFYGNGLSFLFSTYPVHSTQDNPLDIYKWTGSNTYCQICDDGQLAMGGGGSFGLIINDNFSCGTSGRCSTFGNEPLVPGLGGTFDVINFEVYGFVSLAEVYLGLPLYVPQEKRVVSLLNLDEPN